MTRDKKSKSRKARPYSTCEYHFEPSEKTTHKKSKFIFPIRIRTDSSLHSEGQTHQVCEGRKGKRYNHFPFRAKSYIIN